jgi:hypothetical protein
MRLDQYGFRWNREAIRKAMKLIAKPMLEPDDL